LFVFFVRCVFCCVFCCVFLIVGCWFFVFLIGYFWFVFVFLLDGVVLMGGLGELSRIGYVMVYYLQF